MDDFSDESLENCFGDEDLKDCDIVNSERSQSETESEGNDDGEEDNDINDHGYEYRSLTELVTEDIMGMEFGSEHDAYRFYYAYGKFHGFAIRKDEVKRESNLRIQMRQFVCNKAGLRDRKHLMRGDRKKEHRPLTRTDCKAKLRVRFDERTNKFKVVSFYEGHNHVLCPPNYVPFIGAYRGLTTADKAQVDCLHAHGVRTCQIMGFMMEQKGGPGGVGFNKKDVFNYLHRSNHSKVKDGDVVAAVSYLQCKADNDPMFFARYVVTEDGQLKHLFWADSTSVLDFQCFGDVLVFDSTYKKNKYNKPLVIFSGKNHHGQTVLFGFSLLGDECTDTYKWLLETFLDATSNKHPQSVVTDGDHAMREAIKQVFPNASHRLCAWQLQKNACENVKNNEFLCDFKRAMYSNFSVDKFEQFWEAMVAKHSLEGNNWVRQTYEKRCMWATAFLRDKFFAGIRTTSLSEGINSRIKSYIRRKNTVLEVLHNLEHSLRDYRYNEMLCDFKSFYTQPVLTSSLLKIEAEASKIFTRDIFFLSRAEIVSAGAMNVIERIDNEEKVVYKVETFGKRSKEYKVELNKSEAKFYCQCMMYESRGIPCSHVICAMRLDHIDSFPKNMICKRWLKDAKISLMSSYESEKNENEFNSRARFASLVACCNKLCDLASKKFDTFNVMRNEILKLSDQLQKQVSVQNINSGNGNVLCDPTVVKTKGITPRGKKKNKSRKCSNCNKIGHVITTCLALLALNEELSSSEDSQGLHFNGGLTREDNDMEGMCIDESGKEKKVNKVRCSVKNKKVCHRGSPSRNAKSRISSESHDSTNLRSLPYMIPPYALNPNMYTQYVQFPVSHPSCSYDVSTNFGMLSPTSNIRVTPWRDLLQHVMKGGGSCSSLE